MIFRINHNWSGRVGRQAGRYVGTEDKKQISSVFILWWILVLILAV